MACGFPLRRILLLAAAGPGLAPTGGASAQTAPADDALVSVPPASDPSASVSAVSEEQPQWMVGLTAGSISREGDGTRPYGSLALSRRVGRGYVRASVARFDSVVRQVDVRLKSTYTTAFLSAGATFGRWFVDGYGALGTQRYDGIETDLGTRPVAGRRHSGVVGAGVDGGYVAWLSPRLSLTPSASLQVIRSRALRGQVGPAGPGEYETRETGVTVGGAVRIDRFFGDDATSSVGLSVSHLRTDNASAALSSGTRGALDPGRQGGRAADGWTQVGGNAAVKARRNLYLDAGVSRTLGAAAGDLTTTSVGARLLF